MMENILISRLLRRVNLLKRSCIPARWVCDRQKDCPLGEDETEEECKGYLASILKTHLSSCLMPDPGNLGSCLRDTQFTCNSGECISSSWKCDGNFDCDDGSDETAELCSPETNSTTSANCDVERGSFLCDGGSLCLNSSQVFFKFKFAVLDFPSRCATPLPNAPTSLTKATSAISLVVIHFTAIRFAPLYLIICVGLRPSSPLCLDSDS